MALLVLSAAAAAALRRVSQSFKFNTLIRRRFLSHRQSRTGRIVFVVMSPEKEHVYSAEIQKGGTLGPATRLPPVPFESICYDLDSFQVCNGLICLRVGGKFHIFSPYTGEVSTLPDYPHDPYMLYDPVFYFGFHPLSNEYKVLFFARIREAGFWIFSSSSLSWSRIHPPTPERFDIEQSFSYCKPIFLNGSIHSIYEASPVPDYIYTGRPPVLPEIYVLAFDMADEKFRKIPYPDFSSSSFVPNLKLTEFGGCLVLIKDYFYCPRKLRNYDVFECWTFGGLQESQVG
jgi:F-box interacting protein